MRTRERCASIKWEYDLSQCLKVSRAVGRGVQLIVVDNTNTMAWEMKPYITLAVNNGYKVYRVVSKIVVYHGQQRWVTCHGPRS